MEIQNPHKIQAAVLALTKSEVRECQNLITFELTYPRIILAELNTHRVFSRSTSSSRAVPVDKVVNLVDDGYKPVRWGLNQSGMKSQDENLTGKDAQFADNTWNIAKQHAQEASKFLSSLGVHKQWANRLTEPFSYVKTVLTCTSDSLKGFLELRNHPDAQDEIQILARLMYEAYLTKLGDHKESDYWSEWHLPYISEEERATHRIPLLVMASAMRCCGVSYFRQGFNHKSLIEAAHKAQELAKADPRHASPFEHQAFEDATYDYQHLHGNLKGWVQYRKLLDYFTRPDIKRLQQFVNESIGEQTTNE